MISCTFFQFFPLLIAFPLLTIKFLTLFYSQHLFPVLLNRYTVSVYDQFVLNGGVAVLRCHIQNNEEKDQVRVISWLRDDGLTITAPALSGLYSLSIQIKLFVSLILIAFSETK